MHPTQQARQLKNSLASGATPSSCAPRRFVSSLGNALVAASLLSTLVGCEVDSWMDPSRTGYFETTPTTMPILSRLDVIERQGPKGQTIVPPATEDLVPSELKYRLSPGDVLRVEIFELVTPGQDRSQRSEQGAKDRPDQHEEQQRETWDQSFARDQSKPLKKPATR